MPKNSSSRVRAALIGASALAALASGLMTAPSHAVAPTDGPTPGRQGTALADHTFSRIDPHTTLKFIRNRSNPRHSLLQVVRFGRVAVQFRAGSGAGLGKKTTPAATSAPRARDGCPRAPTPSAPSTPATTAVASRATRSPSATRPAPTEPSAPNCSSTAR
jgi:hypothetical protein